MKLLILFFGCMWALTQGGHDNTVTKNFKHAVSSYYEQAEEQDVAAKSVSKRNECREKCFCGTSNVNSVAGGSQVRQNKYPWTAQLIIRNDQQFLCGGSLINDRYVLTSANCVYNISDQLTIRLLQLDRSSPDPGITRQVEKIVVHPQFDHISSGNDVALLKLDSPVPTNDKIRPVCLPSNNQNFDNKDAIVAGWGSVEEGGAISNYLKELTVPIITNRECNNTIHMNTIQDDMLCAGFVKNGGNDACQGDGGGPLIVNEDRYILAGVVSFGIGCGKPNAPGVYARVSKFLDWIQSNTRDSCYCGS